MLLLWSSGALFWCVLPGLVDGDGSPGSPLFSRDGTRAEVGLLSRGIICVSWHSSQSPCVAYASSRVTLIGGTIGSLLRSSHRDRSKRISLARDFSPGKSGVELSAAVLASHRTACRVLTAVGKDMP